MKRFIEGERPDAATVFRAVAAVANRFMDFSRSLTSQQVMCELVACYVLATYLLDAFNVIGYLWPNGDRGTGKTNFLQTVCEMGYLGQVILAGGSYASLRDLADYGATLGFDDAEGIMDIKRADPDKRALLLAGNRRGATVTVKELVGECWVTRYIHAFCPRLFSAIKLPDNVLGSRAVTVPLVRSEDEDRAKANPLDHATWPCDRRRLIDDLWAVALAVLPKLRHYDAASADRAELSGRNLEPWRAVLAVALWLEEQHCIEGLFGRMEKLSREYQQERGDLEADDPVRVAIKALRQMVTGPDGEQVFTPKELASHMNLIAEQEDLTDSKEGKDFTNARKVGWLLKRLRFRRAAPGKAREWKTSHAEVEALARTYGMGSSQVQETTESPASSEMTNRETF